MTQVDDKTRDDKCHEVDRNNVCPLEISFWCGLLLLLLLAFLRLQVWNGVTQSGKIGGTANSAALSQRRQPAVIPVSANQTSPQYRFVRVETIQVPQREQQAMSRDNNNWQTASTSDRGNLIRNTTFHVVTTNYPWSVQLPTAKTATTSHQSEEDVRAGGNKFRGRRSTITLQRTSEQAQRNKCLVVASNAGPFQKDGSPLGSVVHNGTLIHHSHRSPWIGIGIATRASATETATMSNTGHDRKSMSDDDRAVWILGNFDDIYDARSLTTDKDGVSMSLRMQSFVTGFDWLVYQGQAVANNQEDAPSVLRAPRTAIGVNKKGELLLVVADGCEKCILQSSVKGPTLEELAKVLVQKGAIFAVNMDGGSSSTLVISRATQEGARPRDKHHDNATLASEDWKVINRPTCLDVVPVTCERPVSTIHCI